ncbi:hypothetical protein [Streptomyces bluensis]|uniref:WXG100 family type VII secretion target n=1 Tax=Streptomyces bluensis TaxID=33897 RepID=A0ABW6USR2_9ACTN
MSFTDTVEPTSYLKAPQTKEPEKGAVSDVIGAVSDLLSPSAWAAEALKAAFDFDPFEEVAKWFAGDWEGYAKCADAWANVGKLTAGIAKNLDSGNGTLDRTWNGNAADSAFVYFEQLADKIEGLQDDFDQLKQHYDELYAAVWAGADLISGLCKQLLDEAIIAGVAFAAGTLLAETGVGLIAGYAVGALEIIQMIKTWGRITEAYSACEQAVMISVTASGAIVGGLGTALQSFPEVGGAYDHPAV